jgi:hypothetical protein
LPLPLALTTSNPVAAAVEVGERHAARRPVGAAVRAQAAAQSKSTEEIIRDVLRGDDACGAEAEEQMRGRRVLEAAAEHVHNAVAAHAARPCFGATRATATSA